MKRTRISNGELSSFEKFGLILAALWTIAAVILTLRSLALLGAT